MLNIVAGGLDELQVLAMLQFHYDTNIAVTPRGSAHVFDVARLKEPDVSFWSAWDCQVLMGVGALKRLNTRSGEIKSMHTLQTARRSGVGRALLQHIMAAARASGLTHLYLETGSFDYFAPARALYESHGFAVCAPFGGYTPDSNSTFMEREI
jgi:putative acetyltransferase